MSAGLTFFTLCFPSLFSIVDPLATVPIFLALTAILVIGSLLELDVSAALAFGVLAAGVPVSFAYRAFR